MKRLIITALSTLVLAATLAPTGEAQVTTVNSSFPATAEAAGMGVTPFNLVFLAYQGFFESEDIPMAGGLISWYRTGRITAEDLVQAAINMNRLSADALNDDRYIRAVNNQLSSLANTSSGT
jgi:CHAT domain-containing protein